MALIVWDEHVQSLAILHEAISIATITTIDGHPKRAAEAVEARGQPS